jgi:hypothetical protein
MFVSEQTSQIITKTKNFRFFYYSPKVAYAQRLYGTEIMRFQETENLTLGAPLRSYPIYYVTSFDFLSFSKRSSWGFFLSDLAKRGAPRFLYPRRVWTKIFYSSKNFSKKLFCLSRREASLPSVRIPVPAPSPLGLQSRCWQLQMESSQGKIKNNYSPTADYMSTKKLYFRYRYRSIQPMLVLFETCTVCLKSKRKYREVVNINPLSKQKHNSIYVYMYIYKAIYVNV